MYSCIDNNCYRLGDVDHLEDEPSLCDTGVQCVHLHMHVHVHCKVVRQKHVSTVVLNHCI